MTASRSCSSATTGRRGSTPRPRTPRRSAGLLAFAQPGRFDAYPVATEVNNTRNNGADLLLPLPAAELHGVVDLVTGEVVGA